MPDLPLFKWSATQLTQGLRQGECSAIDVVASCLEQVHRLNPQLKAFITVCEEAALAEAREADCALLRGEQIGPLHGIPFAVKDMNATAGIRTTYGSVLFQDHIPSYDDLCVARLKAAGGILIGKTSVPEFGLGTGTHNRLIGITRNPHDPNKTSGDSSGGSAVAVASGMCPVAQGGDMGGSVRTPASFCGIVGLRPSVGRIPRVPKRLLWDSLFSEGVLARTIEDAALMMSVMAGADPRDPLSGGQSFWPIPPFTEQGADPVRVGFSVDLGVAPVDSEVALVFQQAIAKIAGLGLEVNPEHPDCGKAKSVFETLRAPLLLHGLNHLLLAHRDQLSADVLWEIERGRGVSAADYLQAEETRGEIYQSFMHFFDNHDILATVSSSIPPFPADQSAVLEVNGIELETIIDYLAPTYVVSLTGLPCLSIPCGWTASGLPVGMQLVGKPFQETELLQFAYLLQERLSFRSQWPL